MELAHLNFATETVQTPGGSFAVRGLNLVDIISLVRANREPLGALFNSIKSKDGQINLDDPMAMLSSLATQAPDAAAQIICLAADEPDLSLGIKLPFPTQLDALEKIAKLTFEAEGGAKKVLETVIRVATGTVSGIKALQA